MWLEVSRQIESLSDKSVDDVFVKSVRRKERLSVMDPGWGQVRSENVTYGGI
jgi:hypothetical protein